jgi:hypothetical protein
MTKNLVPAVSVGLTLLVTTPVFADECDSVNAFIQLGQSASKCVAAVQANNKEAKETLHNYRYCSEVTMIRGAIEKSVETMPAEKINQCANKRQGEYTAAATALQKMYQLELRLK